MKAGKQARIRVAGAGISTTDEPMELVSGSTWKVTDRTKVRWDRSVTPVFKDNGGVISVDEIAGIQYLTGQVVFKSTFIPDTFLTVDCDYKPSSIIAGARRGTINRSINLEESQCFTTTAEDIEAGVNPSKRRINQISEANGSFGGFYDTTDNFDVIIESVETVILEYQPNVNDNSYIIYIEVYLESTSNTFNVEDFNEVDVNWVNAYPVEYEPE